MLRLCDQRNYLSRNSSAFLTCMSACIGSIPLCGPARAVGLIDLGAPVGRKSLEEVESLPAVYRDARDPKVLVLLPQRMGVPPGTDGSGKAFASILSDGRALLRATLVPFPWGADRSGFEDRLRKGLRAAADSRFVTPAVMDPKVELLGVVGRWLAEPPRVVRAGLAEGFGNWDVTLLVKPEHAQAFLRIIASDAGLVGRFDFRVEGVVNGLPKTLPASVAWSLGRVERM